MTDTDSCTLPSPKKTFSITFFPCETLSNLNESPIKANWQTFHSVLPTLQKSKSCDQVTGKNCTRQLEALDKIKHLQSLAKNLQDRVEAQNKKLDTEEDLIIIERFKEKIRIESEIKTKHDYCSNRCEVF